MTEPSIRIGPFVYDVLIVDDLRDGERRLDGNITYDDCVIRINSRLCEQMRVEVLWHEVIHGILAQAGLRWDDNKIDILAHGLMRFRQDNPEV